MHHLCLKHPADGFFASHGAIRGLTIKTNVHVFINKKGMCIRLKLDVSPSLETQVAYTTVLM